MTLQIQDLIKQVGTDISGKWVSVDNANVIAELIVFECVKIATFKGDATTGRAIKQHFGVNNDIHNQS